MAQYPIELILARQLASQLAVAVLLVDAAGDTVFFNEPAGAILGRSFEEVDALPFAERSALLAPRTEAGAVLPVEDLPGMIAMRQSRVAHASFQMHGLDGTLRPVAATAFPLESAGGQVLGAFILMWLRPDPQGVGAS
ncbi:MAG TPA: PAS domain-containing protein [Gemmatimonadales bacterium]|nr:PAS domain-containing protein [Gemmatimonadales bacterium]